MNCRTAPAGVGFVHDVVVEKSEIMEHLDTKSLIQRQRRIKPEGVGHCEGQNRTQAFAATVECIFNRLIESGGSAGESQGAEAVFDEAQILVYSLHQ